jgi:hypothetical protein
MKTNPSPPSNSRLCSPLPSRADPKQKALSSLKSALHQAHARLIASILPDANAHTRSDFSTAMCTGLLEALSKVDSAIATKSRVIGAVADGIRAYRSAEDYLASWQRMHTDNPTADSALALEDARRQLELVRPSLGQEQVAAANTDVALAQRELAQLLTKMIDTKSSSWSDPEVYR